MFSIDPDRAALLDGRWCSLWGIFRAARLMSCGDRGNSLCLVSRRWRWEECFLPGFTGSNAMATKKTVKTAVKKTTSSSRTADAKAGPKKPAAAQKPPAGKVIS